MFYYTYIFSHHTPTPKKCISHQEKLHRAMKVSLMKEIQTKAIQCNSFFEGIL